MRKFYAAVIKCFEWILFALFALLIVVVFANIFSRSALRNSLPWAEELSRFLFVWITFIGAVLVNKNFGHMRLDLLVARLPKRLSILLEIVVSVLATAVMYIMLRGGYAMMMENLDYLSPALEFPYGIVNGVVPVCCAIMFLQTLVRCAILAKQLLQKNSGGTL
jgi:TRAP-type C4-dicarboxylate transport system permease small subunit